MRERPTKAQSAAAEVSIYLQSVRTLKAAARKYARQEHSFLGRRKYRKELKNQLIEMYVTQIVSPLEQTVPKEKGTAQVIYEAAAPILGEIETKTRAHS